MNNLFHPQILSYNSLPSIQIETSITWSNNRLDFSIRVHGSHSLRNLGIFCFQSDNSNTDLQFYPHVTSINYLDNRIR